MEKSRFVIAAFFAFCVGAVPGLALGQGLKVGVGGVGVDIGSGDTTGSGNGGGDGILGSTLDNLSGVTSAGGASDQENALNAVRSNAALPLDRIMQIARQQTDAEIIDAQLISVRGFLLYDLKLLDAKGDVSHLYFYAKSGRIVRTN